jgi:mono/diheme cytochrome c family protein
VAGFSGVLLLSSCQPKQEPAATTTSFVSAGKSIFSNRCARCHGGQGQGALAPAVIGSNQSLGKYNTAKGLFDIISVAMPFDAPGTLSRDEYLQVLSFILVENKFTTAQGFSPDRLDSITLK